MVVIVSALLRAAFAFASAPVMFRFSMIVAADSPASSGAGRESGHRELEAMVDAGMPALDAIKAATLLPAQMLGLPDRGSLEVGKRADLLVLDANPLDAIANTRRIHAVIIGGTELDRPAMSARFLAA